MANSLTDWLATRVLSSWESHEISYEKDQDKESLLGDVSYLKGAKVQIVRFFAPQSVNEPGEELILERIDEGGTAQDKKSDVLWACVSDRQHFVHIRFSHDCVNRFNNTYARKLISLSGSIIILRKFRPSISFVPSILENKRNKRGPFAPSEPIRPTMYLEVESFEILGSINEVIFWDTKSLQISLHSDEYAMRNRSFKSWFRQVEKILMSEERQREKRRERLKNGDNSNTPSGSRDAANETISSASADTTMTSTSGLHVSPYAPPPFQRPPSLHRGTRKSSQSNTKQKSQDSTQSPNPWGSFELSMGTNDDFGIEAAASQYLDRQSQGGVTGEEGIEEDQFDPLSISSMTSNPMTDLDIAMPNASEPSAFAQISSNPRERRESLSARSPSNGAMNGNSSKDSTFVSGSFSLPFSIVSGSSSSVQIDKSAKPRSDSTLFREMQDFIAIDSAQEDEEQVRGVDANTVDSASQLQREATKIGTLISDNARGEERHTKKTNGGSLHSRTGSAFSSKSPDHKDAKESTKHTWDKFIRRPSPEVLKERERTYSSRVNMIID